MFPSLFLAFILTSDIRNWTHYKHPIPQQWWTHKNISYLAFTGKGIGLCWVSVEKIDLILSELYIILSRDRTAFVLTSDMAYVIKGGEKGSHKFQTFVDLCCQAFNILRRHSDLFLTLFSMVMLTLCGLVTPCSFIDLGQHWLVAWRHQAITWTNH